MVRRSGGVPWWPAFVLLTVVLFGAACSSPDQDPTENSETFTSVEADTTEVTPLEIVYSNTTILCDGRLQDVGEIRGAEPGEVLGFESALPIDLADAVADEAGTRKVSWSCEPEESRLRWSITATGQSSGRSGDITFTGTLVDESAPRLDFVGSDEPFVCDGQLKPLGTISGGEPNELLVVSSLHTGTNRHEADGLGEVPLWWICRPDEATDWEVVVEGQQVDQSLRFVVNGVAAVAEDLPELRVAVSEDPFSCDGTSRTFATVSNLYAFETVTFTSKEADGLIDGTADETGELPIRWQCGLADVAKTWTLTATGVDSGRTISFSLDAAEPAAGVINPLAISIAQDPFVCNGESRTFATLENLLPNEFVDFSSPDAQNIREGQANDLGALPIRWQCFAADDGRVWEVTATGRSSTKSLTFSITGTLQ